MSNISTNLTQIITSLKKHGIDKGTLLEMLIAGDTPGTPGHQAISDSLQETMNAKVNDKRMSTEKRQREHNISMDKIKSEAEHQAKLDRLNKEKEIHEALARHKWEMSSIEKTITDQMAVDEDNKNHVEELDAINKKIELIAARERLAEAEAKATIEEIKRQAAIKKTQQQIIYDESKTKMLREMAHNQRQEQLLSSQYELLKQMNMNATNEARNNMLRDKRIAEADEFCDIQIEYEKLKLQLSRDTVIADYEKDNALLKKDTLWHEKEMALDSAEADKMIAEHKAYGAIVDAVAAADLEAKTLNNALRHTQGHNKTELTKMIQQLMINKMEHEYISTNVSTQTNSQNTYNQTVDGSTFIDEGWVEA